MVDVLPRFELGTLEPAIALARALEPHAHRSDADAARYVYTFNTLSVRLSEAGRPGGALARSEEAVRLHRALAERAPEAYTPGLALSLNNLAGPYAAKGRHEEAIHCAEEALRKLEPFAARLPGAVGGWMRTMRNGYLERCRELERAPDGGLVERVDRLLEGGGRGAE